MRNQSIPQQSWAQSRTILLASVVVLVTGICAEARYGGGTGEPDNPYRIETAEDLNDIGNHSEDWSKNFIQVNDVDIAGYTGTQFNIIGNDSNAFTGVFDGNDHTISNFTYAVADANYVGIFGYVGTGGQIKNLGLEDCNVSGHQYVGGLAGCNYQGTITDCYSTGTVSGLAIVGGLAGSNGGDANITNCYSTANVTGGGSYVGGLVGSNNGTITNCYSAGSVSNSGGLVGGLVGLNCGTITNCNSTGSVLADNEISSVNYVGGLVGTNSSGGRIENCHSTGSITVRADASGRVGGLVGYNRADVDGGAEIINCYATGSVTVDTNIDSKNIGGLVGENKYYPQNHQATISNSYSTVSISGGDVNVGGLVGSTDVGEITNCYYEGSVGGKANVGGLVGHNNVGDIENCHSTGDVEGNNYVGGLVGNGGYIENCYSTCNVSGTGDYVGGLVGAGGYIESCYNYEGSVSGDDCVGGLVGWNRDVSMNQATISKCYSTGSVKGDYYVGGLVGDSSEGAIIEKCYSTGSVDGNNYVSGLVGRLKYYYYFNSTITQCFSTGDVNGVVYHVGGLVGNNGGDIKDSYSTCNISRARDYVGGLVGDNTSNGTITRCYSAGSVIGDSNVGGLVGHGDANHVYVSFWDVNTSGQTSSDGGAPKTTVLMQTKSTFTNAGWDFVCETVNGANDVWTINEGNDYPKLTWWECFPYWDSNYQEWLDVNRPPCWCYKRQCHGDCDNTSEYIKGKGYYYAHFKDMALLLSAWDIREPNNGNHYPGGPGIKWPDPNICADFAHNTEYIKNKGYYRVHYSDLGILTAYYNVKEPPDGNGIDPNCLDCP